MNSIISLFTSGGVFMIPLGILSFLSIAVIFERAASSYFWIKTLKLRVNFLTSKGEDGVGEPNRNINKALFSLPLNEQKIIIEEYLRAIFEARDKNYELLNIIGGASPLLGFIGTVSGMISSFQAIANADKVSIKLVASGISEALITTGFGLIIAVVCIVSESVGRYFLTSRAHKTEVMISMLFIHAEHEDDTVELS